MSILPQQDPSMNIAPNEKQQKPKSVRKEILSWFLTIAAAVIIALVVRTYLFEPIRVDGESMTDTLQNGELMFVTKPEYIWGSPSRQDIIICRYPNRKEYFVKRLIALPGDTIEIKYDQEKDTNTVYVNGEAVDESFLTKSRNSGNHTMAPVTLKDDEYFVMGDNRNNSNDSRYVGALHRNQIVGHVRLVFYPFNTARAVQ